MAKETIHRTALRTPLSSVRGMGSAKTGTRHWWMQRMTSLALLPITLWFCVALTTLASATYVETVIWIAQPMNAVLLLLLVALTFHHLAAGMQVVVEDYVRNEHLRQVLVLLVKGGAQFMAVICVFAVLRIAFAV